jgi:peptide-methionine (S)-S-oxide reductase
MTRMSTQLPNTPQSVLFGMGCFWGAERLLWQTEGVVSTSVGYAGGRIQNPTYKEVCYSDTGHAEVVYVEFDPSRISFIELLKVFWENHDPTQGMCQGNDVGSQYRSAIMCTTEAQLAQAQASKQQFEPRLLSAGFPEITTEIVMAPEYFLAEDYHQRYLEKNPNGYCGIGGTGVSCPVGLLQN